jgi:sterol-4alpha-carboxylate 3-dehydrogenase (decarboxylating)
MWRLAVAYNTGRNNMQMGDNTNLVDMAYAGNVADAHILAADRLRSDSADLVAGQIFFISNGGPVPYWNFPRMVWREMGDDGKKKITVLPKLLLFIIAYVLEFWYGIRGLEPPFRVFDVTFTTTEQWFNIDKVCI